MMEVSITAKHSNVYYIYKKTGDDYSFEAVENATGVKDSHGLDLFKHKTNVYEGRSGFRMFLIKELANLAAIMDANGGLEGMNARIEKQIQKTGESPRYTRPDERKQDIFPPCPEKENTVFAKDCFGGKHYYYRFYNENGLELYTLKNDKDPYRTIFTDCEGFMLGLGGCHRLDETIKWLAGLENGIKGEVERRFNESMENSRFWADPGFANILGRADEANAHNAPIREARDREHQQRDAEREAERVAEEQAAKAEYEQTIKAAESKILNKQAVRNADIQGKSLIMQLFREHEIAVPLKTQGWIIKALHSIEYNADRERWSYRYYNKSRDSTVFSDYLPLLVSAVQTKQQFEEMSRNGETGPDYDSHIENEHDKEYDDEI